MSATPEINVCLSIDTEEDNWQPSRDGVSVANIRQIPRLQAFLESLGGRPTYFTAHSVVAEPWAAEIMRGIAESGRAEVGGHLHPWNTPPTDEPFVPRHTMMRNLPTELQLAKMTTLTHQIEQSVGSRPSAFRAGRWGLGVDTLSVLSTLGYRVDSSVMPYVNWEAMDDGANFVGAPIDVYRLGGEDFRIPDPGGQLIEVPVSSGYSRKAFDFWHDIHEMLHRKPLDLLRLAGIASRTRLVRKIQLSPETDSARDMLVLSERLIELGVGYLHMFWHSPSMSAGFSPYGETQADVEQIYHSIGEYFDGLAKVARPKFLTVTELADAMTGTAAAASQED